MRRRAHQLEYVRPVVPDVCPWPMRASSAANLGPGGVAGGTSNIHAEAAGRARQPLRKIALTALAGRDAATAETVAAAHQRVAPGGL
jgi:hypothetical protein